MATDNRAERLRQAIRRKKEAAQARIEQAETNQPGAATTRLPTGDRTGDTAIGVAAVGRLGRAPEFHPRPAREPARLGEMQRGLWLAHQLDPQSPAYHLASAFQVPGTLDRARLESAFNQLIVHHRLLRSTFRGAEGEVFQKIHSPSPRKIECFQTEVGEFQSAATAQAKQPFDLESGPLHRLLLFEEPSRGQSLVVWVMHHILADERSLGFLWQEMAEAYGQGGASAENTEASIPSKLGIPSKTSLAPGAGEGLQFDDYVHWQRVSRQKNDQQQSQLRQDRKKKIQFWRDQLDPMPEVLRLPFEKQGITFQESATQDGAIQDGNTQILDESHANRRSYQRVQFPVDEESESLSQASWKASSQTTSSQTTSSGRFLKRALPRLTPANIRDLARETGSTPFMVYAFAFQLLLHRYLLSRGESEGGSQAPRISFAIPVSTRTHVATANMMGYFLNPVVVCGEVDEDRIVEAAIGDFGAGLRKVMASADLPFQDLVEELAPPRVSGRHPIFQTMFVYQEVSAPPRLGKVQLEPMVLDLGAAKFDLTFFVTEAAGSPQESSLELAVEYRCDRFDEHWMEALLGHYETLIEHLPRCLRQPTAELPLVSGEERRRLESLSQGPPDRTENTELLPRGISRRARSAPEASAVICGGKRTTYGELEAAAATLAQELSARGVSKGQRVGVFVHRSSGMIAAILAAHGAGAAYVPLDPTYPRERTKAVLEDAEVSAVLTTGKLKESLPVGSWEILLVDSPGGSLAGEPSANPVESLAAVSPADPPQAPSIAFPAGFPAELEAEDTAYLLYTSGSTGKPKGVVISHGNLAASTRVRAQVYETPSVPLPTARFLLIPSLAFDSSVAGLFWTLAAGGALVVPTDDQARDPRQLARLVKEQQVTALLCVPSLYAEMLRAERESLGSLAIAIVAGESCTSRLVEEHFRALPKVRLFNEYGPTEGTVWATVHEMTPRDATRPVAIGRPIPGAKIEVLDPLGRPVPAGVPGQAWIEGPTVAQGYWRRPDLTEDRFLPVPGSSGVLPDGKRRYRTGDRTVWAEDGRLLFLGRQDEQIKLRGFRIEPGEVEAALLEVPQIVQAAVVGQPRSRSRGSGQGLGDGGLGDSGAMQLVAFVQAAGEISQWRTSLEGRLPAHMVPGLLVELPELPLLPNGKVNRKRLQQLSLEEAASQSSSMGPTDSAAAERVLSTREQALLSLWAGLLGRADLRVTDNFFTHGGHSLLVVEMSLAIERDFGVSLAATDVFANPTVQQVSQLIGERLEKQVVGAGAEPPIPYQHLFPIQPGGRGKPFIIAVPHFFSAMFATRFRGERPVYGLRGVSLRPEGNRGRWPTMKHLGEELVSEIRRRFPESEGYFIAGYSFGASMAIETVRLMEEQGLPVDKLYLIAPMPANFYRWGPFRVQLEGLRKPVEELSLGETCRLFLHDNNPLTRRPYARARHWLTVRPWRQMMCWLGDLKRLLGQALTPRILHADVRLERFRLHSRYRPSRIQTPTVVFNAQETETDAAATWRPHFEGPFTIVPTPDPHLGDEAAQAARKVMLRHLEKLDSSGTEETFDEI